MKPYFLGALIVVASLLFLALICVAYEYFVVRRISEDEDDD